MILEPKTALNLNEPVDEYWNGFSIAEIRGEARWWLAASRDGADRLSKQCEKSFGAALPEPGRFTPGRMDGKPVQFFWTGERQWLVAADMGELPNVIEITGYATDQSDGWVGLVLSGNKCRAVMEKLCQLDLHEKVFPAGSCARMAVEGMIALIACEDAAGRYRLMFQRSSARSMVGHIRHAAFSTCGEKIAAPA